METTSNTADEHTSTESFINQSFVGMQTINDRHTINLTYTPYVNRYRFTTKTPHATMAAHFRDELQIQLMSAFQHIPGPPRKNSKLNFPNDKFRPLSLSDAQELERLHVALQKRLSSHQSAHPIVGTTHRDMTNKPAPTTPTAQPSQLPQPPHSPMRHTAIVNQNQPDLLSTNIPQSQTVGETPTTQTDCVIAPTNTAAQTQPTPTDPLLNAAAPIASSIAEPYTTQQPAELDDDGCVIIGTVPSNIPPRPFHPSIYRIQDVEGDGNCLFRAISVALHNTEHMHRQIRTEIVQHIVEHWADFFHDILGQPSYWRRGLRIPERRARTLDERRQHQGPSTLELEQEAFLYAEFMLENEQWAGSPEAKAAAAVYNANVRVYDPLTGHASDMRPTAPHSILI